MIADNYFALCVIGACFGSLIINALKEERYEQAFILLITALCMNAILTR